MPKTKHWTEKAKITWVPSHAQWRVRIQKNGRRYQWWLGTGGDATGRLRAAAKWDRVKSEIRDSEQSDSLFLEAEELEAVVRSHQDRTYHAEHPIQIEAGDRAAVETFLVERTSQIVASVKAAVANPKTVSDSACQCREAALPGRRGPRRDAAGRSGIADVHSAHTLTVSRPTGKEEKIGVRRVGVPAPRRLRQTASLAREGSR